MHGGVPELDRTFLRQLATTQKRGLSEETVQVSITSRHSEVERRVVPLPRKRGAKERLQPHEIGVSFRRPSEPGGVTAIRDTQPGRAGTADDHPKTRLSGR